MAALLIKKRINAGTGPESVAPPFFTDIAHNAKWQILKRKRKKEKKVYVCVCVCGGGGGGGH